MSEVLSIRLPDDIKERLEALSAKTKRPVSVYVREAIVEKLDDLEDYYLAIEALEEYRKDPTTYSLEEVAKRLGVEV